MIIRLTDKKANKLIEDFSDNDYLDKLKTIYKSLSKYSKENTIASFIDESTKEIIHTCKLEDVFNNG